jgi:hypothetical protein
MLTYKIQIYVHTSMILDDCIDAIEDNDDIPGY